MPENIYNFDEKRFLIGFRYSLKRIITRATLELGRITKAKQDRSHEFISLLAYISTIRKQILPLLVYKGKLGDLMSTQVNKVVTNSKAHFTVSPNGQLNNTIRLSQLQNVFKRYTKLLRTTQKSLLIIDRYLSHVNIAFINQAN